MGKNTRTEVLRNIVDPNLKRKLVNQILFEEIVEGGDWKPRSLSRLLKFGISIKTSSLKLYHSQLIKGEREADCVSVFDGNLYENEKIFSRNGKENIYRLVKFLIKFYGLEKTNYVGLPANQILYTIRKYDNVVACEKNLKMWRFMRSIRNHFASESSTIINYVDIFSYLNKTKMKFSIYDLDLMEVISKEKIIKISNCIVKTAQPLVIISLISCVGRSIKEKEYKKIMPSLFIEELEKRGCEIKCNYSDKYIDKVHPMMCELLVVKCPKQGE